MTIDHMDTRVDVTATPRGSAAAPAGGPASPEAASPQGTLELRQALAPIIRQVIEEELAIRLRIAGLR